LVCIRRYTKKLRYDEGGDKNLSPRTPPLKSDDDVVPVQELSQTGKHKATGVRPPECVQIF